MRRMEMGEQVLAQLIKAENAIDAAFIEAGALVQLLPAMRLEQNYSAVLGNPAFRGVARSIQHLSESRSEMVAAHHALAAAAPAVGLRTLATGTGQPKEMPDKKTALAPADEPALRLVG